VWTKGVKADGTRGWIPMNKRRVRVYQISQDGLGPPEFVTVEDRGKPLLAHISHFTTCPNASEFSQKRKPR